jgi:ATP-dependent exoDNAse (exonuclease V) beta subunit
VSKKPEPAEAVEVATAEEENAFSLDAADLGTEIHEVLSRLEWDIAQVDLATCTPKARELLEIFLSTPESKALFSKPGAGWELWRERAFDLAIDGKWISGIFDRVHIRREGGKAIEAHILDYKTNRKTPEAIAEEYEGQMEQYRQAASRLLGLPLEKITAKTVPIRRMT